MKIVIGGAGDVGTHLARMLSEESHEITLIGNDEKKLQEASNGADIITIEGDVTMFDILKESGISAADLYIAVSTNEKDNILSASIAKALGAKKSIARIDNSQYLQPDYKEIFIKMGIDYMFYPERIAARQIVTLLGHTSSTEYIDFSGGKLTLMAFRLDETSSIVGKTLIEVAQGKVELDFRTIAISRGDETIIPRGDDKFKVGDMIYIISQCSNMGRISGFIGKKDLEVKNIMILGGSQIAKLVASTLQDEMNIKLVDYDPEKAFQLAEELDKTLILNEDGRKMEVMLDEGIEEMDAFIALTGRSETNILTSMFAKKMGVKKTIAEVENLNFIALAESIGIDSIINKKLITADAIFGFTANVDVKAIKCLYGSRAEVLEFIVKPDSTATRGKIKHLNFPQGSIIGGVVRDDDAFIAIGDTELKAFDRVVVFALPDAINKIGKFFE